LRGDIMRIYESDSIRNVAILGHSGAGKSNMTEALEFTAGLTTRISNPNDAVKISSDTTLHTVEYQSSKFNFLDIPGYSDFFGELESALAAADGAIIIVDGTTDLSVGTETSLELADSRKIPRFIFVNKIDSEKADYEKILSQLREKYGKRIAPFHVPWGKGDSFKGHINVVDMYAREYDGKECHNASIPEDMNDAITPVRDMLLEAVAETNEELMYVQKNEYSGINAVVEITEVINEFTYYAKNSIVDRDIILDMEKDMDLKKGDRIYIEGSLQIELEEYKERLGLLEDWKR